MPAGFRIRNPPKQIRLGDFCWILREEICPRSEGYSSDQLSPDLAVRFFSDQVQISTATTAELNLWGTPLSADHDQGKYRGTARNSLRFTLYSRFNF
jgi:hypothetical protein